MLKICCVCKEEKEMEEKYTVCADCAKSFPEDENKKVEKMYKDILGIEFDK